MNETSITRITIDEAKRSEDLTDLERVNSMDESEIEANALSDPDNQVSIFYCVTSIISAKFFLKEEIIIYDNYENQDFIINAIFLYTQEDKDLVKYVITNYNSLDVITGDWCKIYVLEQPSPNLKSLKKYWLSLLKAKLYERCKAYRWITNAKPFDKNESYKIAEKLGISPAHFPCLVILPPFNKLTSEEKLIIPIKTVSKEYFRQLFSVLWDTIFGYRTSITSSFDSSEDTSITDNVEASYISSETDILEIDNSEKGYESIRCNFEEIIQYLEENAEVISKQEITKYEIQGETIFVNSKLERLKMTQNNPSININESNIASVTGEGKIDTAITHQHNYAPEQKQTLAEAAAEIQRLLKQLEETNPTATQAEQKAYVTASIPPTIRERFLSALQAGWKEAVKELLDNSYFNVGVAILEGWQEAE